MALCLEPTDTKKLDVPSARSNVSGNSFNHVSSPYMTSLPEPLTFIWASHVSWEASVAVLSASSKLRITSRKEGIEPVVMALILGMVIVGDVACAVKGMAAPLRISLTSLKSRVSSSPEAQESLKAKGKLRTLA